MPGFSKHPVIFHFIFLCNTSCKFLGQSPSPHDKCCLHVSGTVSWHMIRCCYSAVCVCVYTLPPVGFFRLHDVFDIREKFGSTIFCCEYQLTALCQVPSSPYLKMSYFTSKDENSSRSITGEKTI